VAGFSVFKTIVWPVSSIGVLSFISGLIGTSVLVFKLLIP